MLDLLSQVVMNEAVNKMSSKNCAIVIGPNLFDLSKIKNPMEVLMISNKICNVLRHLLVYHLREKYGHIEKIKGSDV